MNDGLSVSKVDPWRFRCLWLTEFCVVSLMTECMVGGLEWRWRHQGFRWSLLTVIVKGMLGRWWCRMNVM